MTRGGLTYIRVSKRWSGMVIIGHAAESMFRGGDGYSRGHLMSKQYGFVATMQATLQ